MRGHDPWAAITIRELLTARAVYGGPTPHQAASTTPRSIRCASPTFVTSTKSLCSSTGPAGHPRRRRRTFQASARRRASQRMAALAAAAAAAGGILEIFQLGVARAVRQRARHANRWIHRSTHEHCTVAIPSTARRISRTRNATCRSPEAPPWLPSITPTPTLLPLPTPSPACCLRLVQLFRSPSLTNSEAWTVLVLTR
ncbi:hypothetical protein T492DRAFT_164614 [Pavlovales sp. CCMP2436]|nr:hypothetical protein T492DRAFT_164614 [Pavlovales sp. CCMP2436]